MTELKQVSLYVDTRETPKTLKFIKALQEVFPNVERRKLDAGDILIMRESSPILIERKSWNDLLHSWFSGRLGDQLIRLHSAKVDDLQVSPYLIVEGNLGALFKYTKISVNAIVGCVTSLAFDWNMQIIPSQSMKMTVQILQSAIKNMKLNGTKKNPFVRTDAHGKALWEQQLAMLMGIEGVGVVTSMKLLEQFGDVRTTVCLPEADLKRFIGEKTGSHVYKVVNQKFEKR